MFNPELVLILQGGEIVYDPENPDEIVGYNPPVSGSRDKGEVFKLNAYTAQYDASGQIVKYEKMTYPNCQGVPVAFGSEDGAFRAPEYTINSAPRTGEAPYNLRYVKSLPVLVDEYELVQLTVESKPTVTVGMTILTVTPEKDSYQDKYMIAVSAAEPTLPRYGEMAGSDYTQWDGKSEVNAANGVYIAILECNADGKVMAGGVVVSNAKTQDDSGTTPLDGGGTEPGGGEGGTTRS